MNSVLPRSTNSVLPRPTVFFPTIVGARLGCTLPIVLVAGLAGSERASAQTLALRHYDVADGLSSSRVVCMHQDGKGYLWMGTWEGVCRFDGHDVVAFGRSDGIENPVINAIAEDRHGDIWVATNGGGIAHFLDTPALKHGDAPTKTFASSRVGDTPPSNVVDALLFDAEDNLWCGTEAGLFETRAPLASPPKFERITSLRPEWQHGLMCDRSGRVWLGTSRELVDWSGGKMEARSVPQDPPLGECIGLFERDDGSLLCGFERGLLRFAPGSDSDANQAWSAVPLTLDVDQKIRAILPVAHDRLWIATTKGLVKRSAAGQVAYTMSNGLSDDLIGSLLEDRDHELWIGTWSGGACKLVSEAIANFTAADGIPAHDALRLVASRAGPIVVTTGRGIVEIDGDRVMLVPGSRDPPFEKIAHRILQDRRGDFWVGTDEGLFRCTGPRLQFTRLEKFGPQDGIPNTSIFGIIHEAHDGTIWVSTEDGAVYAFDPLRIESPRFHRAAYDAASTDGPPREWFSAANGEMWLAPYNGLWRYSIDRLTAVDGLGGGTPNQVRCFHQGVNGDLWVGTRYHGVSTTSDPDAEHPRFKSWSTRDGLASDAVWSITEDARGRIYLGTARGLERLDPKSGCVHHITTLEGLAGDIIYHCITDARGFIWVATSNGVSRIDPLVDEPDAAPPPVYIARVQLAGRDLALPSSGTLDVGEETLSAADDNLRVDYRAVSLGADRDLRYQYRLEGADRDWSEPTTQRSVNYAQIAPGSYRFLVRAAHGEGATSARPATFAFRILPPFWRTWWFLTLASAAAGSIALALHRVRVRRVVALESIRRQIATDIHDDMGAGLSQIAILSEVAKRESDGAHSHLDEVARLARGLRDSMSDIVWAVDPRRDHASDLVQRMRQVAFNLFEAEGVKVELTAPPNAAIETIGLAPDKRRHLLLIFKEAVSNIARHARASEVHIDIRLAPSELALSIRDDGVGFDPAVESRGQGLASLRLRATSLGARLSIQSAPGHGTSIALSMPL